MSRVITFRVSDELYERLKYLKKALEEEYKTELTMTQVYIECIEYTYNNRTEVVKLEGYVDKDIYNKALKSAKKHRKKFTLNNILKGFIKFS